MTEPMHRELAAGRWGEMPLAEQLGNIGSEVSRAVRWKNKGDRQRMNGALDRALELLALSIQWAQREDVRARHPGALRELCRLWEVLCDYFVGENEFHSDDISMQRYFDQFALAARR